MPRKLNNPYSRHVNVNFSVDNRVVDMLREEALGSDKNISQLINEILKKRYGVID